MTGFDVTLRRIDTDPPTWLAQWQSSYLSGPNELLEKGKARMVVDHGGYPYIYEFEAGEVLKLFTVGNPSQLDEWTCNKFRTMGWNEGGFNLGGRFIEQAVGECPPQVMLQLEAWDQS